MAFRQHSYRMDGRFGQRAIGCNGIFGSCPVVNGAVSAVGGHAQVGFASWTTQNGYIKFTIDLFKVDSEDFKFEPEIRQLYGGPKIEAFTIDVLYAVPGPTHTAKPTKKTRDSWDYDFELIDGVFQYKWFVLCARCGRRYRGGHHWAAKCKKMFPDETTAKFGNGSE